MCMPLCMCGHLVAVPSALLLNHLFVHVAGRFWLLCSFYTAGCVCVHASMNICVFAGWSNSALTGVCVQLCLSVHMLAHSTYVCTYVVYVFRYICISYAWMYRMYVCMCVRKVHAPRTVTNMQKG